MGRAGQEDPAPVTPPVVDENQGDEPPVEPPPPDPDKIPHIDFAEAKQAWEDGTLFVDARAAKYYAEGHIPGAVNIPAWAPDIAERIAQLAEVEPTAAPVIVYCNESKECEDSHIVGNQMRQFDFEDLSVYEGGFPGWQKSGNPIATGEEPGPRGPEK